jgi:hypothetical protein
MADKTCYRIFISYSSKDRAKAKRIANILAENGMNPIWDMNLRIGLNYVDQIKKNIAHAHVFLLLITSFSDESKWVQQEIGYSVASNIPILPVVIEDSSETVLPGEMIQQIEAIRLDNSLTGAKDKLRHSIFDALVKEYRDESMYCCCEMAEERALKMAEMANYASSPGQKECVRQAGGLSSFHIPCEPIDDLAWKLRYEDDMIKYHIQCQRNERIALEKHARAAGCKLIVNPDHIMRNPYRDFSKITQRVRLGEFLKFLESMPDDKVDVVFHPNLLYSESLTIVGEWFVAESCFRSEQGFIKTMFTSHAPGIHKRIEEFDIKFLNLLADNEVYAGDSRITAIRKIKVLIEEIEITKDMIREMEKKHGPLHKKRLEKLLNIEDLEKLR